VAHRRRAEPHIARVDRLVNLAVDGAMSLPFEEGQQRRRTVKVIDPPWNAAMWVFGLESAP
jgi:hypothetical protein